MLIPFISSWKGSQQIECDLLAWARREGQRYQWPSCRISRLLASLVGVASSDPSLDTRSHSDPVVVPLWHGESYFLTEVHCLLVCPVRHPRPEHQGDVYSHSGSSPADVRTFQASCSDEKRVRALGGDQLAVVMLGQGRQLTLAEQTPYFVGTDVFVLEFVGWHVFTLSFFPK